MKTNIHLTIVAIIMALVSCTPKEDPQELLNNVCDQIRGKYICKSITFKGEPLDLNNDGISGNDLIKEFEGFQVATHRIHNEPVRIPPVASYNESQNITFEIPKQRVNYDKRNKTYIIKDMLNGDSMFICFTYTIDESGRITAKSDNSQNNNLMSEDDDTIYLIDYNQSNRARKMTFDQKGKIEALIDCTFYDFATETLVTVPTRYIYERTSYSLY